MCEEVQVAGLQAYNQQLEQICSFTGIFQEFHLDFKIAI